jgi:hypothetical protein
MRRSGKAHTHKYAVATGATPELFLLGTLAMNDVASIVSMHRRTLDRHLQKHGMQYGEIVASIKQDIARQAVSV